MVFVAGGVAMMDAVGRRNVDGDGGDAGDPVHVLLGVPVEVAERGGGHVGAVGLDELESGDEVVLLGGVFGGGVLGLAEDEGGVVGPADERAGFVGADTTEDHGAVVVLAGGVAGLDVGIGVVVNEVVLGDDGEGV